MSSCCGIRPLLSHVVEGEVSPDEAMRVARHLARCTACKIALARERRLAELLEQDLEDLPVGEEFVQTVMDNLPHEPPPRRRRNAPGSGANSPEGESRRHHFTSGVLGSKGTRVPPQKFVAYFGESSAFLARRDDEEYRQYFEEEQRRQGRRGPAKYVTNFWDRTLGPMPVR